MLSLASTISVLLSSECIFESSVLFKIPEVDLYSRSIKTESIGTGPGCLSKGFWCTLRDSNRKKYILEKVIQWRKVWGEIGPSDSLLIILISSQIHCPRNRTSAGRAHLLRVQICKMSLKEINLVFLFCFFLLLDAQYLNGELLKNWQWAEPMNIFQA